MHHLDATACQSESERPHGAVACPGYELVDGCSDRQPMCQSGRSSPRTLYSGSSLTRCILPRPWTFSQRRLRAWKLLQQVSMASKTAFGVALIGHCSLCNVGVGLVLLGGCFEGCSWLGLRLFLTSTSACLHKVSRHDLEFSLPTRMTVAIVLVPSKENDKE